MVKVALVNPDVAGLTKALKAPPFSLMCLSAYINDVADVQIIDAVAGQNIEKELLRFQPDWVGVTVRTPYAYEGYRIADFARKELDCKVVLGGHHITARPNEAIQHADHIVVDEGEVVLKQLINGEVTRRIIKGVPVSDLDEVPPLPWETINFEFYVQTKTTQPDAPFLLGKMRKISMMTSRGCPYKCIFCRNALITRAVRFNSAERVCFEVDRLIEDYKINSISFLDDEFLLNRKRLREICCHFKEVGLVWGCQARATTITDEIADLLSKSGCAYVGIGFESGNPRILNLLKAGSATVERNIKAVQILKNHGITVLGNFIFGTPSETYEEMMDTVNFIIEQPLDGVSINALTPFPDTPLWSMVKDKVKNIDYSLLASTGNPSVILCDTMSKEKFKQFFQYASSTAKFKRGLCLARLHNGSWLRLFARHPFYPYFLTKHPLTSIKILRKAWS